MNRFVGGVLAVAGLVGLTFGSGVLAARAATPGGKPIVIGASVSLTGRFADGGKYTQQGYQEWVDEQNAKGGLLGRPLELKIYDDQSDAATGVRLYERLVNEDHVDLLAGPYGSALTAPTTNVAERYKMAMICPEDAAPATFQRGLHTVFQGLPAAAHYVDGVLDIAKSKGYKTIAVVGEDSPFPHAIANAVPDLAKKDGMTIVYTEFYPPNNSDFSSLVQKIKAANPDVVLAGSFVPDSIGILRGLKQVNFAPKILYEAIGGSDPAFSPAVGADAEGVMATTAWSATLKTSGNDDFVKAFTAKYGRPPDYHAASAYSGLMVLAEAVKRAGSLDQEKIIANLASLSMPTLLGTYKVEPATGLQIGYQAYVLQWQGAKQPLIYPPDRAQAKPLVPVPSWQGR
jgi:branched-chain amino acid transport system substrate-binding protein